MAASVRARAWIAILSSGFGAFAAPDVAQVIDHANDGDRGYPAGTTTSGSSGAGSGASSSAFGEVGTGAADVATKRPGATATSSAAAAGGSGQPFASPEAAVKAFIDALRAGDDARLERIFGGAARGILSSGDKVADKTERATFLRYFDRQH